MGAVKFYPADHMTRGMMRVNNSAADFSWSIKHLIYNRISNASVKFT